MALADGLRQGSFRGVPFQWDEADADLGRRNAKHEYPLRDKPYVEDLGRKAREFTLSCFVTGFNWQAERDALITACETKGPGRLVHPHFGEMSVSVMSCQARETTSEVGVARFQITFVEAGDITFAATVVPTPGAQTMAAASTANQASQAAFAKSFDITNFSDFVGLAATGDLGTALNKVQSSLGTIRGYSDKLLGAESQISFLKADPLTYLGAPIGLGGTIGSLIASVSFLGALSGATGKSASSWSDVYGGRVTPAYSDVDTVRQVQLGIAQIGLTPVASSVTPPPAIAATLPDRVQQAANQTALFALVRQAALAEAAQAAVATPFPSHEQAIAVRDDLADQLDQEMLRVTDDDVYQALADLRVTMVREITSNAVNLPDLLTYTPVATLPALVIASRLYDDPSWADDIVARNDIRHPGFVPGGQPLQVLSDV